jgi:hypothetical protein
MMAMTLVKVRWLRLIRLSAILLALLLISPYVQAHNANYCIPRERDSHGHIKRSLEAKHEFKREHPCPANGMTKGRCEDYIIDHKKPLKRGGADSPSNMQWQTIEESKAKDAVE